MHKHHIIIPNTLDVLGVGRSSLYAFIAKKKYPSWILGASTLDAVFSAALVKATHSVVSEPSQRNKDISKCAELCRILDEEDVGKEEYIPTGTSQHFVTYSLVYITAIYVSSSQIYIACRSLMGNSTFNKVGDLSFTIIRHPFPRSLSASLYKVSSHQSPHMNDIQS